MADRRLPPERLSQPELRGARFYHPAQVRHGLVEALHMLARHDGSAASCNPCALAIAQAIASATEGGRDGR